MSINNCNHFLPSTVSSIILDCSASTLALPPEFAAKAVDIATAELVTIAAPGQVSQEELSRAKEATKSAVVLNLESRMIVAEEIGRQYLTYGERKPLEHFLKAVEQITLKDIANISRKVISSPLKMASYGDVINVPSYESVSSKFHAQ